MKKLIVLGIVVVIIIIIGVAFFNLPQRIGLVDTPTEKLLSATPDREAAAAAMAEFESTGIDTEGIELYIFPVKGTADDPSMESVAFLVFDASEGADLFSLTENELIGYMEKLSNLGQNDENNIERVAIDYRNEGGESLLTLTAPAETIRKFANGSISREQFLEEMEGQVDFTKIISEIEGASQ
jgi:hypothetical protein